jgi:hypothetical protein
MQLQYWKTSDSSADDSMKEHSIIYAEPPPCWLRSSRDQSWPANRHSADDLQVSIDGRRSRRQFSRYESVEFPSLQAITTSENVKVELSYDNDYGSNVEKKTGYGKNVAMHGRLYDLWPYTNVSVRVAVLNTKYQSPPSDVITFMTDESGRYFVTHYS